MSKEIELKYSLTSPASGQEILQSSFISENAVKDSRRLVSMRAVYYDDEKLTLTSQKIGYRVRKENEEIVATVKWTQKQDDRGLSVRHEYNAAVSSDNADTSVFKGMIQDEEVLSTLLALEPVPLFTTEFTRDLVLINYSSSVIEVALDLGLIYNTAGGELQICELECELKEGKEEELIAFGKSLSERFGLSPLPDSKLKRGLSLLKNE